MATISLKHKSVKSGVTIIKKNMRILCGENYECIYESNSEYGIYDEHGNLVFVNKHCFIMQDER